MNKKTKTNNTCTFSERFLDVITLLTFIFAVLFLFIQWNTMPEKVPIHYNEMGKVDRLGFKAELFLLPLIGTIIWIGMSILEKYPHLYNYMNLTEENKEQQYKNGRMMVNVLKNEVVLLFSFLIVQSVHVANGTSEGLGVAFDPVLLIVMMGTIVFFILRILRA